MGKKLRYYFTFSGRISRGPFVLFSLFLSGISVACTVLALIISTLLMMFAEKTSSLKIVKDIAGIIPLLALGGCLVANIIASLSLAARRLHDFNYSARWIIVFFVLSMGIEFMKATNLTHIFQSGETCYLTTFFTLTSLFAICALWFIPGTKQANRFGENPNVENSPSVDEKTPLCS